MKEAPAMHFGKSYGALYELSVASLLPHYGALNSVLKFIVNRTEL